MVYMSITSHQSNSPRP